MSRSSSSELHGSISRSATRRALLVISVAGAAAVAGCSADIGRFDLNGPGLASEGPRARPNPMPAEPLRRNAGGPVHEAPPPAYSYNPSPSGPPPGAGIAPVRQAGLPEPISREPATRDLATPPRTRTAALPSSAVADAPIRETAPPPPAAATGGNSIEVRSGDTIYGLSKKHRVSISELMSVNGLQNPTIRPGQRLVLPSGGRKAVPSRRTEVAAAPPGAAVAPSPAPRAGATRRDVQDTVAPTGWTGTYTITARDSLYGIARRFNVKVAELQAANGITEPTRVRAGTVLKVPGPASATREPERAPVTEPVLAKVEPTTAPIPAEAAPVATPRPRIINAGAGNSERVAAVTPASPVLNDASAVSPPPAATATPDATKVAAPTAAGVMRFRWPAKGRVIAGFGPRGDNTHNDGINISVPLGTDVHAAEAGVVAYAGSELKGYGNLVLIRHSGNWVSAYAHNESLLVKRGDKVTRGQTIAKAGKTGAVDQPQVHFELRQGSKPVDPMPHLER
jgi:murein DD-endopeptidase MepM/ murein hydrolase activator NlpD